MELLPKDFCIFIASHISKSTRIPYLRECLDSLFRQQIRIQIYLSISFENHNIQIECMHHLESFIANAQCNLLNISIRNIKTPQMQHLYLLHNEFGQKHTWIMFCDDDDSYTVDRTNYIISAVSIGQANLPNKRVAGVYENVAGTHHTIARQEYWCYCINIQLLTRFFEIVAPDSRLLNNTCCDVLLGEYLRRLSPTWSFAILTKPCYQYRIHNNADSITGAIQSKHGDYHPQSSCPPEPDSPEWAKYVIDWNDFLHNNLGVYIHDTYLRTLVGYSFDQILRHEFLSNYSLLDYIDQTHITKLRDIYTTVKKACDQLYDIAIHTQN